MRVREFKEDTDLGVALVYRRGHHDAVLPDTLVSCDWVRMCLTGFCSDCQIEDEPAMTREAAVAIFEGIGRKVLPAPSDCVCISPAEYGDAASVCSWARMCPTKPNELTISCAECPADTERELVTREEAIAWWKEAKVVRPGRTYNH